MAKDVQQVGGPAEQEDLRTGLDRQVTIDTSSYEIRVHDGVTQGGQRIPNVAGVQNLIDVATGGAFGSLHILSDEAALKALTPSAGIVAVVIAAGLEETYIWHAGSGDQGTIPSDTSGYWQRIDSVTGTLVRSWRAGLINLQVDGVEPVVNQPSTIWLTGGVAKAWDGSAYIAMTPALYGQVLLRAGIGVPNNGDMLAGSGGTFALLSSAAVLALIGAEASLGFTPLDPANNLNEVASAPVVLANIGALAKASNLSDVADAPTTLVNLGAASRQDTYRNRIVNPCMQVSQENGNSAGSILSYFLADQWDMEFATSDGVISGQRIQSVTLAGALNRIRISVTTADTAFAAGEYLQFVTKIEGGKIVDAEFGTVNAKPLVVRFMGNFPAGTYCITLQNADGTRSYVNEFTAIAGVDTVYEVVYPGDTAGTWPTGAVKGAILTINLATGSTFQTTKDTWQAGNYFGTAAMANGLGAIQSFDIGDIGLKIDFDNTGTYGRFEVPDPVETQFQCERYYEISQLLLKTAAWNALVHQVAWSTPKRLTLSAISTTPTAGSGGAFATLDARSFYQSVANSIDTTATVIANARM